MGMGMARGMGRNSLTGVSETWVSKSKSKSRSESRSVCCVYRRWLQRES
jgi:hypothetical protein